MKYHLTAKVTISVYTTVHANTLEEAIKKARDERTMMAIIQDGSNDTTENWMTDELDGEPYDIKEQ